MERKVADLLGGTRKPVTGRKGEDITHPLLYPDVKSRIQVPKTFFDNIEFYEKNHSTTVLSFLADKEGFPNWYLLWRLENTERILNGKWNFRRSRDQSWPKLPLEWMDHIASTSPENKIPIVVLHRPRLEYGKCLVLAYHSPLYTYWMQKRLPLSMSGDSS